MSKFEFEDILRYSELYKSGYSLTWPLQFIANNNNKNQKKTQKKTKNTPLKY